MEVRQDNCSIVVSWKIGNHEETFSQGLDTYYTRIANNEHKLRELQTLGAVGAEHNAQHMYCLQQRIPNKLPHWSNEIIMGAYDKKKISLSSSLCRNT